VRGRIMEWYGEGPRFKSPACTNELSTLSIAIIVFLMGGGMILLR
jgi:hypothetical protein